MSLGMWPSSVGDSASESPWGGAWPPGRACSCWMNHWGRWMPLCAIDWRSN
jgi:hypothetical protein